LLVPGWHRRCDALPSRGGAGFAGDARAASGAVAVRHAKAASGARACDARCRSHKAGDILVSLDTTALDRQIAALGATPKRRARSWTVSPRAASLAALTPPARRSCQAGRDEERIRQLHQRSARYSLAHRGELDLTAASFARPYRAMSCRRRACTNDTIDPGATWPRWHRRDSTTYSAACRAPGAAPLHRLLRSLYQETPHEASRTRVIVSTWPPRGDDAACAVVRSLVTPPSWRRARNFIRREPSCSGHNGCAHLRDLQAASAARVWASATTWYLPHQRTSGTIAVGSPWPRADPPHVRRLARRP